MGAAPLHAPVTLCIASVQHACHLLHLPTPLQFLSVHNQMLESRIADAEAVSKASFDRNEELMTRIAELEQQLCKGGRNG